jgi:hypothetical protein
MKRYVPVLLCLYRSEVYPLVKKQSVHEYGAYRLQVWFTRSIYGMVYTVEYILVNKSIPLLVQQIAESVAFNCNSGFSNMQNTLDLHLHSTQLFCMQWIKDTARASIHEENWKNKLFGSFKSTHWTNFKLKGIRKRRGQVAWDFFVSSLWLLST